MTETPSPADPYRVIAEIAAAASVVALRRLVEQLAADPPPQNLFPQETLAKIAETATRIALAASRDPAGPLNQSEELGALLAAALRTARLDRPERGDTP